MREIPDAPWIRNAERYGTAYRDAWVWGYSDDDDYGDYENDDIEEIYDEIEDYEQEDE